jgi:acetyl-CoA C-acetyltransferase
MVRIISTAAMGVRPDIMGIGPVAASKKALARVGLSVKDMDIIEINEAFAAQVLACLKGLDVAFDDKRVNPNGGAIALGHPLGATGAMVLGTLLDEMERRDLATGLVNLCVGAGMGTATILERA